MARPLTIGIVGGGIGGLAAALSLLRGGFDVHVFEQARAIGEIGAGIQISPNAARILQALGLRQGLDAAGVKPLWRHQRRWDDGRTLSRGPLGAEAEARFGAPYYNVHRADLVALLAAAVPPDRLHLGHRFIGLSESASNVTVRFEGGASFACDALIGADGIHSAVRTALYGAEAPQFTGCVAYRGLVPVERVAELNLPLEAQNWMGPGKHLVHYFVSGATMINIVGVVEQDSWTGESWTDKGDVADVLAAYDGWHGQVRTLLGAMDETYKWALFDRPPLVHWSSGRVTLLGDSCHAMLPMMAQGAAQAIEDGATLAACLGRMVAGGGTVAEALADYERVRKPRTSRLQEMSRANKINFHLPDGSKQRQRDARMSAGGTDWAAGSVAWLYDHDASAIDENGAVE